MSQTFVVVQISLQTGGFILLSRYLRSQLFVWVGVLMVYTILDATPILLHLTNMALVLTNSVAVRGPAPLRLRGKYYLAVAPAGREG